MNLTTGLETKTDEKLSGGMEIMENVTFSGKGTPHKREGKGPISTSIVGGGSLEKIKTIFSFNDELLAVTRFGTYSFLETAEKWKRVGAAPIFSVETLNKSATESTSNLSIKGSSYTEDGDYYMSSFGSSVTVRDKKTGTLVAEQDRDFFGSLSLEIKQMLNIGNTLCFVSGSNGQHVELQIFNKANLSFDIYVLDGGTLMTSSYLDAVSISGGNIGLSWYSPLAGKIVYHVYDSGGALVSSVTHTESGEVHGIQFDGANVLIVYLNVSIKCFSPTGFGGITTLSVSAVSSHGIAWDLTQWHVYSLVGSGHYTVEKTLITKASGAEVSRNILLYADAGITANDGFFLSYSPITINFQPFFFGTYASGTQSVSMIFNEDGEIVGAFGYGNTFPQSISSRIPPKPHVSGDNVTVNSPEILTESTSFDTVLAHSIKRLGISHVRDGMVTDAGESTYYGSSYLMSYSGGVAAEHGFFVNPEALTKVSETVTASGLTAGVYQYIVVYEWIDSFGQKQVSTPSPSLSVTVVSASFAQIEINFQNTLFTNKGFVTAVLYRTIVGTVDVYYRTLEKTIVISSPSTSFYDKETDADIKIRTSLYTTGGIIENTTPVSSSDLRFHNERIFKIDSENRKLISYSKVFEPEVAMEFSDSFRILVEDNQGRRSEDLSCLASLDGKLIMFKKNSILGMAGEGPDNTGLANDFTKPELITTDVGCDNPKSIALTPDGIIFQSSKGIYLIDRGLQVSYIGYPVEAFNGETVVSSILMEDINEIRFITELGKTLVYEYFNKQWTVFSNYESVSACLHKGKMAHAKSDDTIFREDGTFSDNGAYIPQKLTTGWLKINGSQAYQRVYEFLILGEYKSEHKLKINLYYDYKEYSQQEIILTASDANYERVIAPTDSQLYAGDIDGTYQWRIRPEVQKCQAMKIEIVEETNGTVGEGLSFSNLSFIVGVKKGSFKTQKEKQG